MQQNINLQITIPDKHISKKTTIIQTLTALTPTPNKYKTRQSQKENNRKIIYKEAQIHPVLPILSRANASSIYSWTWSTHQKYY